MGAKGGQVWRDQDWIQAPGVALVKENLVCVVRGVWVWGGGGAGKGGEEDGEQQGGVVTIFGGGDGAASVHVCGSETGATRTE